MVRYRFPANPGFNPPDRAEPQQSGESEWEDFPSQIAPPRQPHNVVLSPIGETGWGPDPQAFEEEYDHDHGHIAHLWDAGEGRQGEPPLTSPIYDLSRWELYPDEEPAEDNANYDPDPSFAHIRSGTHEEPGADGGLPYAARFFDPADPNLEHEERGSAYTNHVLGPDRSRRTGGKVPLTAHVADHSVQDRNAREWAAMARPDNQRAAPPADAKLGMGSKETDEPEPTPRTRGEPSMQVGNPITNQLTVSDPDSQGPDTNAMPDPTLVSGSKADQGDRDPRHSVNPRNPFDLGEPDEKEREQPDHGPDGRAKSNQPAQDIVVSGPDAGVPTDPLDLGYPYADTEARYHLGIWNEEDPTQLAHGPVILGPDLDADTLIDPLILEEPCADAEARYHLSTWNEGDPTQPAHDSVVLGPDADQAAQPLVATTPTSPQPDRARGPSPKRRKTHSRRLFSGMALGMLTLISLATTTEAYIPGIPNGTTGQPGGPEAVLLGLGGPTCSGTGWEGVTRVSCGLIFLLIPLMAKLATRIQQLEDAPNQKPVPIELTSTANPDNQPTSGTLLN